jgi:hypothetical protein
MIVTTVMTLSLTLAAITRGTKRSRERRGRGIAGVERMRGRHEHEFLQDQVVLDLVEGWEWCVARDDGSKMIVPLVQPLKNVKDEVAVGHGAAEVTHALHFAIVVTHREIALDEVV